jgi:hypothetical protein
MSLKRVASLAAAAVVASAAMSVFAISITLAQEADGPPSSPVQTVTGSNRSINLTVSQGELLKTTSSFAKISVADPAIVEVAPQSDRSFILNAKNIGSTNVFVFDSKNTLIATLDVTVEAKDVGARKLGGEVRIYGRIYDKEGALIKPSLYQCNSTGCDLASEAPLAEPVPAAAPTPAPQGAAAGKNDKSH